MRPVLFTFLIVLMLAYNTAASACNVATRATVTYSAAPTVAVEMADPAPVQAVYQAVAPAPLLLAAPPTYSVLVPRHQAFVANGFRQVNVSGSSALQVNVNAGQQVKVHHGPFGNTTIRIKH